MSQMRMSIMQPTPNAKSRTKREEEDYNFMTLVCPYIDAPGPINI